jgi:hypothetical protein
LSICGGELEGTSQNANVGDCVSERLRVPIHFPEGELPMNMPRTKTYWQRWKQGFSALAYAYGIMLLAAVPLILGHGVLNVLDLWMSVEVAFGVVFVGTLLIAIPVLVSRLGMDSVTAKEKVAAPIDDEVEALAAQLGINWEGHYLGQVGALLSQGQIDKARKLYRQRSRVTWDQADEALRNWQRTIVLKKLEAIRQHLQRAERRELMAV